MSHAEKEFVKLRRRSKKSKSIGAHVYICGEILCKALVNAGIDCDEKELKAKITACKDGKRAKIIIQILKA